jgi:hypothetical protein
MYILPHVAAAATQVIPESGGFLPDELAGLKWSSQHLEGGSCDDEAQAAFGSVWSGAIALTRSPGGGRTR